MSKESLGTASFRKALTTVPTSEDAQVEAILVAARALIADPARHVQGALAVHNVFRDGGPRTEQSCDPTDESADRFCAIGSVLRVSGVTERQFNRYSCLSSVLWERAVRTLDTAANVLYGTYIARVNDSLGHAAVLRCFDYALCQGEFDGRDDRLGGARKERRQKLAVS